jgi:anti-repressor protein
MSNVAMMPVIAGVEITTDEEGRFNLNSLHKASGLGANKAPHQWLRTKSAKALIQELESDVQIRTSPVRSMKGNSQLCQQGTFAHELLAISYAGWISPAFQLKVNQVFLDYRTGKLAPVVPQEELSRMEILKLAMESESERLRLAHQVKEDAPKVAFCNRVIASEDVISVSMAAKIIGTGRNRLFAFMRQQKWVNRENEPYQDKITSGLLDVKVNKFNRPNDGLTTKCTTLVTGKGLYELERLYYGRTAPAEVLHHTGPVEQLKIH